MKSSALLKNIQKWFGEFQALKKINLEIHAGEFIALLGPSGCGKTTLLRLIAGFEKPTKGQIWINEEVIANENWSMPPEKRRIGMVFQSFALWPHMTVFENITFPLKHQDNIPEKYTQNTSKRVYDMLNIVGLQGFENRYPNQLSGGQKQRVALARALVFEPSILLMDEPLSSLDAELRIQMRKEIQDIHRELGTSIIYVTHDQSEALAMADRIVVMRDGNMEQIGTPEEIYFTPETKFVATFCGKANLLEGNGVDRHTFAFTFHQGKVTLIKTKRDYPSFLNENILPIRPEQIILTPFHEDEKQTPLLGVIHNKQFQGKEMMYSVRVGETQIEVISSINQQFQHGDLVSIEFDI